jgi:trimethylamine--corrinoid protein Co-methyltransferase
MNHRGLNHWCEFLTGEDVDDIHNSSMRLLSEVGIRFPDDEILNTFKQHEVKTEGEIVFLSEKQVMDFIATAPSHFTLFARNPAREVTIGHGHPIFAPGYGAPFLIDLETGKRSPTLSDYENLVKLCHNLPNQDLIGHQMVMPADVPSENTHLKMLQAGILHSDKAFLGSTAGFLGAKSTIEMAKILFGGDLNQPVTLGLINPISPLGYSPEMIDALKVYAKARQPCLIATLVMAGSTGPITLAGTLAQQNAEILAGIVLTQLLQPGTAVIYGSASSNTDMRTGTLSIGSPEMALLISAHNQFARHYGLPSRSGGALTDSSRVDAQAGYESMLSLLTTVNSGTDFVLHAAGILAGYLAFSYEKLILDDERIGMVRRYLKGFEISPETTGYEVIAKVGHGGHFLGEEETLARCRTAFWQPTVAKRNEIGQTTMDQPDAAQRARQRWQELLELHEDPPLDKTFQRQLEAYITENTA